MTSNNIVNVRIRTKVLLEPVDKKNGMVYILKPQTPLSQRIQKITLWLKDGCRREFSILANAIGGLESPKIVKSKYGCCHMKNVSEAVKKVSRSITDNDFPEDVLLKTLNASRFWTLCIELEHPISYEEASNACIWVETWNQMMCDDQGNYRMMFV